MSDKHSPDGFDDATDAPEQRIYQRRIRPDPDDPYLSIVHPIAEIEECAVEEMPPLYAYVDHLLENLFSTPPPDKAQVQIEFSYYNYRIELDQRGNMTIIRQGETLELD